MACRNTPEVSLQFIAEKLCRLGIIQTNLWFCWMRRNQVPAGERYEDVQNAFVDMVTKTDRWIKDMREAFGCIYKQRDTHSELVLSLDSLSLDGMSWLSRICAPSESDSTLTGMLPEVGQKRIEATRALDDVSHKAADIDKEVAMHEKTFQRFYDEVDKIRGVAMSMGLDWSPGTCGPSDLDPTGTGATPAMPNEGKIAGGQHQEGEEVENSGEHSKDVEMGEEIENSEEEEVREEDSKDVEMGEDQGYVEEDGEEDSEEDSEDGE